MIYLTAIIKVQPEYRNDLTAFLQNMVQETRKEAACVQYDLHQGIADPNTFIFYEIWHDQVGLDNHNQQEYIREFGTFSHDKLQEPTQIYLSIKV